MATKTLIGFQNATDNKVTVVQCSDRSGQINITGKILNELYTDTNSVKKLMLEGTNPNGTGRIDVSSIVGIDNYTWGSGGTYLGFVHKIYNNTSEYLDQFSCFRSPYQYLYMFSEINNEWQVASKDNQTFRSLASEL